MKNFRRLLITAGACLLLAVPTSAFGTIKPLECDWDFLSPSGVIAEPDGTLVVSDIGMNNLISLREGKSKLAAGFTLPTGSGGRPSGGHLDASASLSLFNEPFDVVKWNDGYAISDRSNHCLRLLSEDSVRTLAGNGQTGKADGASNIAQFNTPLGLTVDDKGLLYIADSGNGSIRTLDAKGNVATFATGFLEPAGLFWDSGTLYVTDAGTHQLLQVKDGKTSIVAGRYDSEENVNLGGFQDGPAALAEFSYPLDVLVQNGAIYVSDTGNSAIRRIEDGWVSTMACYRDSSEGLWPGNPTGLAARGNTLYVADTFAGLVLQMDLRYQLFDDVTSAEWYAEPISYLYIKKIISGTSRTSFSPHEPTTRGQLVNMLYQLEGRPAVSHGVTFADAAEGQYYVNAIAWASEQNLVKGNANGSFAPDQPVTREELITILYHYAGYKGFTDLTGSGLDSYLDRNVIHAYALEPMAWAVKNRMISGEGDGRIDPAGQATRAQTAAILTNFLTK